MIREYIRIPENNMYGAGSQTECSGSWNALTVGSKQRKLCCGIWKMTYPQKGEIRRGKGIWMLSGFLIKPLIRH